MNAISKPSLGAYTVIDHTYDVVVVGAGGSGLRATLGTGAGGLKTAVPDQSVSRRAATRSRRKGGIGAATGQHGRG